MSIRIRVRLTAAVGLLALALAGCATNQPATQEGYVGGADGLTRVAPADRKPAPDVAGPALTDETKTLRLADYRGKVVVLNVWGSWCAPCRAEAEHLVAAAEETKADAVFVGINTRDLDRAPALAFMRTFKVSYDSIYDPKGAVLLEFSGILTPNGIPSTLIIDRQGRVAARIVGTTTRSTVVGLVNDIGQGK